MEEQTISIKINNYKHSEVVVIVLLLSEITQ